MNQIKILSIVALVTLSFTASAQRYVTSSISEYQQLYGKKYTLVKTVLYEEYIFEFSKERAYSDFFASCSRNKVLKITKTGNETKYLLEPLTCIPEQPYTIAVNGDFVICYRRNGQTMFKLKIIKKTNDTEELGWYD
ncbi:MAG: hypothetical protein KF744_14340 [Taibaiella sp.]|nr:hypothetical protein [Taibaiella sp.]